MTFGEKENNVFKKGTPYISYQTKKLNKKRRNKNNRNKTHGKWNSRKTYSQVNGDLK